jgi:PAS domain S-box-containing protein
MNDTVERNTQFHIRLLVDHVPSMLAYWDRDLRCRFANRAYERWFGVDPDSLVGTSIRELLGPDLFAANEPYIRAALRGEQQVFERVVPGPGGIRRHSLATYIPDVRGDEVMGFIAHVTEVTQLKEVESALRSEIAQRERANESLRKSESALRQAQRLGRIGSWSWEAGPDITSWSDEMYDIFGLDPKQRPPTLAQRPALYEPQSWSRLYEAVSRALDTGEPYSLELEYRRPDGRSGWIEARAEAVRDGLGVISGLRGTAQEVSLRHQAEDDRVRIRVLEEGNRNKNSMLSRVSHELRTPLNAILGFAQLCQADPELAPRYQQWAQLILTSGQHMLELVNDVLDLSAADSGLLSITNVDVDLASLVRSALVQCAPAARRAGVRVSGPALEQHVALRSDATRMRQVIDNLVSNAIKYTGAGGTVTVSVARLASSVELSVTDSGIGLSDEQLARLFLPFERLGAERTQVSGTGLGLALTKTLVERLGGTISVKSRVGVGSTFSVTVPLDPATPI